MTEQDPALVQHRPRKGKKHCCVCEEDSLRALGRKVSEKLEDGDIKGAIRLASSDDKLADFSYDTLDALRHPGPPLDSAIAPPSSPP